MKLSIICFAMLLTTVSFAKESSTDCEAMNADRQVTKSSVPIKPPKPVAKTLKQ